MQRRALPEDWAEEWLHPAPKDLASLKALMPQGATAHVVETFMFASRMASELPGTDDIVVSLTASPMSNRELFVTSTHEDPFAGQVRGHRTAMDVFRYERSYPRDRLRDSSDSIAFDVVGELFDRFGFNAEDWRIRQWGNLPPVQM